MKIIIVSSSEEIFIQQWYEESQSPLRLEGEGGG